MRIRKGAVALCAAVCCQAVVAGAQTRTLTLADVVAQARERAPQVVSARLAWQEAQGRLVGASLRFQSNPQIDAALGNRRGADSRFTDLQIGLNQSFEPGSRRAARVAGANAVIEQSAAEIDATTRIVLRAAARSYYRALHANERVGLLRAARELTDGVLAAAERRFKAGDIAVLDVNIARAALARVRADGEAAEASSALALGDLAQLLGAEDEIAVAGTLVRPGTVDLTEALRASQERPELQVLDAAVREAEASVELATTFTRPNYGLSVRYSREEGDQIVLGGLTVSLPTFSTGQALRAAGVARANRLRAELQAARTRVQIEVRAAFEAYTRHLTAVRLLETDAITGLDENERLTTRSFEVGYLGLPELLLIRRELLETRAQYLDALLEAALARVELDASAGLLR